VESREALHPCDDAILHSYVFIHEKNGAFPSFLHAHNLDALKLTEKDSLSFSLLNVFMEVG